jgi:hypothetical protein
MRKLIWYHLYFYEKNKDYVLILLQNIQKNPRFNSTRAYQLIRDFSRLVVQLIEEGKAEGTIGKSVDSNLLRDAILGSVDHFIIRCSLLKRFPKLTVAAAPLYEIFLSGIQAQAGTVTLSVQKFLQLNKSRPD